MNSLMKKLIFLLFITCFFYNSSFAQAVNVSKLDTFLDSLAYKGLAMGSLTISRNGAVQYQKAIGYSYMGEGKSIATTTDTRYRIGSVTKMLTAIMIFQLTEEGRLSPDQKLNVYFPTLPNAGKITLRDMLYHRSGLHDYTKDTDFEGWMDQPKTHQELLKIIKDKGSDFEPGTRADYSNSNYLLLGYIIEKVDKLSYADALKKRITSKINLKNTYYGSGISIKDNESASYKYADQRWDKQKETNMNIHGGAGSVVSTSGDMVKLMDALFLNKLTGKSGLSEMQTMIDGYGMGMFPDKYGSKKSFGHNGRIEGFYSALWYFPEEKLSVAYCTNGIDYPRTDIIEGVLKICFNEPFILPFSKEGTSQEDGLDQYTGTYSAGQMVVNCSKEGNRLSLETRGKVFELEKTGVHYFMNGASGYFFEFNPAKGELQIKETDNIYVLKKSK